MKRFENIASALIASLIVVGMLAAWADFAQPLPQLSDVTTTILAWLP